MKISKVDFLSLSLIVVVLVLLMERFKVFPLFVDIYYHLSVVRGFDLAGGIVLKDFWEFAPTGRTHLYPPLLHIIMLLLHKGGMDFPVLGAFISIVMFPLSLITSWFSMRKAFGSNVAFFSLLMLMSPLSYLTSQSVVSAATLVLVLTPLLFYFFEKDMLLAAITTMTACLYTHLSMPHVTALAFVLYGIFSKRIGKVIKFLAPSYILYLPWALHIALNSEYLVTGRVFGRDLEAHMLLVVFALLGAAVSIKKRGSYLFPLAYSFAMIPIAFKYPARFSDHCLLPLSMLAGLGAAEALRWLRSRNIPSFVLPSLLLILVVIVDPILMISIRSPPGPLGGGSLQRKTVVLVPHETFITSFISLDRAMRSSERMFFTNWITEENMKVAELVLENSEWDEIVFVDNGPYGCFITSFTGRAQTGGMFHEVSPEEVRAPPKVARVIVLTETKKGSKALNLWENPPPFLVRVAKIGKVLILRREGSKTARILIPKPIIPTNLAFILLLSIPSGILIDILIQRKKEVDMQATSSLELLGNDVEHVS